MYIRRLNHALIVFLVFLVMLGGLYTIVFAASFIPETVPIVTDDDPPVFTDTVKLPVIVPGTSLVAEQIVSYDGNYVEDGSEEYVTGIAALYLHNSGKTMVSSCRVIVQLESGFYRFEATCIPPGATVLVQEQGRRPYNNLAILSVGGNAARGAKDHNIEGLCIENFMGGLRLRNNVEIDYENIAIAHKNYAQDQNLFIGGVTYITYVGGLKMAEQVDIWPVHFNEACKIVYIEGNEAQ